MHWSCTRRRIAGCRRHVIELSLAAGCYLDLRSNSVTIALGALQRNLQPVSVTRTIVDPDFRWSTQRRHHDIEFAVVIEVGDCGSAMSARWLLSEASLGCKCIPFAVGEVSKHRVVLVYQNTAGHVG